MKSDIEWSTLDRMHVSKKLKGSKKKRRKRRKEKENSRTSN